MAALLDSGSVVLNEERRQLHILTIQELLNNKSCIKNPSLIDDIQTIRKSVKTNWETPITEDCLKNLVKCLQSSRSGNERESAAKILEIVADSCLDPHPLTVVALLLPVVEVGFLNCERKERVEEIRTMLIRDLRTLLRRKEVQNGLLEHLNSILNVLKCAIEDDCPDVKKMACQCVTSLATAEQRHFHLQSRSLLKPLQDALKHKHSAVRINVIEALGVVVQYGNCNDDVREVCSHLAQRVMDDNHRVRLCVVQQLHCWMMKLPNRYSFYDIFIPLLLSSNIDEICTVSDASIKIWHEVGRKYEEDNYSRLKDDLDFDGEMRLDYYPKQWMRPPLGCRALTKQHAARIFPAVFRDMRDWLEATRLKSLHLLHILILNCEGNVTPHVPSILPALVESCREESAEFSRHVISCAELIGNFVRPITWCESILDLVEDGKMPQSLIVLDALLRGSAQQKTTCTVLSDVSHRLLSSNICRIEEDENLQWLLKCVKSMICLVDIKEKQCVLDVFLIICEVKAMASNLDIFNECDDCFSQLAATLQLSGTEQLLETFFQAGISYFKIGHENWTVKSPNFLMFLFLVTEAGHVITEEVQREVLTILLAICTTEKSADMRLKVFIAVAKLFERGYIFNDGFVVSVIQDIFLQNMKWSAGKTASTLLSSATSCLSLILQATKQYPSRNTIMANIVPSVWPTLLELLRDDNRATRHQACRVFEYMLIASDGDLIEEKLEDLCTRLSEKLDDVDDDVRLAAISTLTAVFRRPISSRASWMDTLCRHIELYLCDQNEGFRKQISCLLQLVTTN